MGPGRIAVGANFFDSIFPYLVYHSDEAPLSVVHENYCDRFDSLIADDETGQNISTGMLTGDKTFRGGAGDSIT